MPMRPRIYPSSYAIMLAALVMVLWYGPLPAAPGDGSPWS
jgi:hypothetical protein